MKLTIDRKRWLRGEGADNSFLRRIEDGKMCCIGFLGKACGIPDAHLEGRGQLDQLLRDWPRHKKRLSHYVQDIGDGVFRDSSLLVDAYDINDDPDLTERTRESKVVEILKRVDVEVVFCG